MKTYFVLCVFAGILLISSCGKSVDVEGHIFSRNNIPMPNTAVRMQVYKGSDYPDHERDQVKTNEKGEYKFHMRFYKNRGYKVFCNSDSGSATSGYISSSAQNIDLKLD